MVYKPAQQRKGKKLLVLDLEGSQQTSWKQILKHLMQREWSFAADLRSSAASTQLSREIVLDS